MKIYLNAEGMRECVYIQGFPVLGVLRRGIPVPGRRPCLAGKAMNNAGDDRYE